jgi:ribonuclease HI
MARLICFMGSLTPRFVSDVVVEEGRDRIFNNASRIYVDGSCLMPCGRAACAGAAVVQLSDDGRLVYAIRYSLPVYLDQAAGVAEIVALMLAAQGTPSGLAVQVVTDCSAVYNGAKCLTSSCRYTKMQAGLWRQVRDCFRGKQIEVIKTKAHRKRWEAEKEGDLVDFDGNDRADGLAKEAAREAGFRELEVEAEAERTKEYKALVQCAMQSLVAYYQQVGPKPEVCRKPVKEPEQSIVIDRGHNIVVIGKGFCCTQCNVTGLTYVSVAKAWCQGVPAIIGKLADNEHVAGHCLWKCAIEGGADHGLSLVFCSKCGCTSVKKIKGLLKECAVPQGGQHKAVLGRIRKGCHPDTRKGGRVSEPLPLGRSWHKSKFWANVPSQGAEAAGIVGARASIARASCRVEGEEDELTLEELVGFFGEGALGL